MIENQLNQQTQNQRINQLEHLADRLRHQSNRLTYLSTRRSSHRSVRQSLYRFTILFFSLLIIVSGCSANKNQIEGTNQQGRVIIDTVGRSVVIPDQINTAAAIDSFTGEAMIMMGAGDMMVACPNGVKRNSLLEAIYPKLSEITVVQGEGSIYAESLMALSPDVAFVKNSFYISESETAKLEKLGIPYLVIEYGTMGEQIEALELIGEVLGGKPQQKAQMIVDYYRDTITLVDQRRQLISEDQRLRIYHSINEAIRTDGEASLGADWTNAVGLVNVSVGEQMDVDGENFYASLEQIFFWDPDRIICNDAVTAKYLRTDMKWQGLRAVYTDQVYNIPVGVTRWGHGGIETFFAMLWAGVTLYPEYYGDIELKAEVLTFYRDVLDLQLDDQMYQMMLSGEGIRVRK